MTFNTHLSHIYKLDKTTTKTKWQQKFLKEYKLSYIELSETHIDSILDNFHALLFIDFKKENSSLLFTNFLFIPFSRLKYLLVHSKHWQRTVATKYNHTQIVKRIYSQTTFFYYEWVLEGREWERYSKRIIKREEGISLSSYHITLW